MAKKFKDLSTKLPFKARKRFNEILLANLLRQLVINLRKSITNLERGIVDGE